MNRYVLESPNDVVVIDGREYTVRQLRTSIKSHEMTKKAKRESARRRRKSQMDKMGVHV